MRVRKREREWVRERVDRYRVEKEEEYRRRNKNGRE